MIDQRLIDYSRDYKEYKNTLNEEGEYFSLEDLMNLVGGFLQGQMLTNKSIDVLGNRDREALVSLKEVYSKYSNL